jgi:hypothetical protein
MLKWENVQELTKGFVRKNLWKLKHWNYEFWDFYNECYIIFRKCIDTYPEVDDNEMKKIYFTSIDNWILNMGKKAKLETGIFSFSFSNEEDFIQEGSKKEDFLGYDAGIDFKTELSTAPKYIQNLVKIIIDGPDNIGNKYICKKLDIHRNTNNVLEVLKDYFVGTS